MELVQVRRSTAWLIGHEEEPIPAADVAFGDPAAALGTRVVVEDLDGALHLAQVEPVVAPDGRVDLVVRIRLRVTVSEALALGVYRGAGVGVHTLAAAHLPARPAADRGPPGGAPVALVRPRSRLRGR